MHLEVNHRWNVDLDARSFVRVVHTPLCMPRHFFALLACLVALPVAAQQDQTTEADEDGGGQTAAAEQTLYDELLADYKNEYLSFGALIQAVADLRPDGDALQGNQLLIANARFRVNGTLNERFGYLLQANFASGTAILDARLSYRPADALRLAAGRYKAPFSAEQLIAAANIDFVNRSRVVSTLSPGRVVGASAEVGRPDGVLTARAGVFNSFFVQAVDRVGGADRDSQTGRFLYVGRLRARSPASAQGASEGIRLSVGASALFETGDGGPVNPDVEPLPDRVLAGGDARVRVGPVLLAAEVIGELVDQAGEFENGRSGYYLTAGYDLAPAHRVLARLDSFQGSEELLLGYNASFSQAFAGQVNVGVPLGDDPDTEPGRTRVLVNFQMAF